MTDPLSAAIALGAGAVALGAGVLSWPRPPQLDGERWFKIALATLLRGSVEAEGGDGEAWARAVLRFVPYHPAGRHPERKIAHPVAAVIPGAALPGELALVEALAARATAAERWRWMYDQDPAGVDARLDDPAALGAGYDPVARFGPGASWDALAEWGAGRGGFAESLRVRFCPRWVLVHGRASRLAGPSLIAALRTELGDGATEVEWCDDLVAAEARVAQAIAGAQDRAERVIVAAEEAGVAVVLRALQGSAEARDRVVALLSMGGTIAGRPGEEGPFGARDADDWLARWFGHAHLDTEIVRLTPYLAFQWLDRAHEPPGAGGLLLERSRFPEPGEERATAPAVESVDLGPLPVDPELPLALVARALIAVASGWALSRR